MKKINYEKHYKAALKVAEEYNVFCLKLSTTVENLVRQESNKIYSAQRQLNRIQKDLVIRDVRLRELESMAKEFRNRKENIDRTLWDKGYEC